MARCTVAVRPAETAAPPSWKLRRIYRSAARRHVRQQAQRMLCRTLLLCPALACYVTVCQAAQVCSQLLLDIGAAGGQVCSSGERGLATVVQPSGGWLLPSQLAFCVLCLSGAANEPSCWQCTLRSEAYAHPAGPSRSSGCATGRCLSQPGSCCSSPCSIFRQTGRAGPRAQKGSAGTLLHTHKSGCMTGRECTCGNADLPRLAGWDQRLTGNFMAGR